jgi:hypothetical protein
MGTELTSSPEIYAETSGVDSSTSVEVAPTVTVSLAEPTASVPFTCTVSVGCSSTPVIVYFLNPALLMVTE